MSATTAPRLEELQMSREALDRQLRLRRNLGQIGRLVIAAILLVVAAIYLVVPFLAVDWLNAPFVGTFVDHTLRIDETTPTTATPFAGRDAGLTSDERITAIDGQALNTSRELHRYLQTRSVGDLVVLQLVNDDGSTRDVQLLLANLALGEVISLLVMPYITGLIYLGIGLWVYRSRREQSSAQVFMLLCAAMALMLGLIFGIWTSQQGFVLRFWTASIPLASGAVIALAMVFPYEQRFLARNPTWRLLPLLPTLLVLIWGQVDLFASADSYLVAWQRNYYFAAIATLILMFMMLLRSVRAASPMAREQSRVVLAGSALAFMPMVIWTVNPDVLPVNWVILAFVVFPLALGYSILRYRFLDSETVASQTVTYAIIGLIVTAAHALLVAGTVLVLGAGVPANNAILIGITIFITLLVFNPVRARLQGMVDSLFFRTRDIFQEQLNKFSHELTIAADLGEVLGSFTAIHP